jgi:hypothetical protein
VIHGFMYACVCLKANGMTLMQNTSIDIREFYKFHKPLWRRVRANFCELA